MSVDPLTTQYKLFLTYSSILNIYLIPLSRTHWQGTLILTQGPFRKNQINFTLLLDEYPRLRLQLEHPFYHAFVRSIQVDVESLFSQQQARFSRVYPVLNGFKSMFVSAKMLSATHSFNPAAGREFKFKKGLYLEKAFRSLTSGNKVQMSMEDQLEIQMKLNVAMKQMQEDAQIMALVELLCQI